MSTRQRFREVVLKTDIDKILDAISAGNKLHAIGMMRHVLKKLTVFDTGAKKSGSFTPDLLTECGELQRVLHMWMTETLARQGAEDVAYHDLVMIFVARP